MELSIVKKDFKQIVEFESKPKLLKRIPFDYSSSESDDSIDGMRFKKMPIKGMVDFYFARQSYFSNRIIFNKAVLRVLNYKHPYKMGGLGSTRWRKFVQFVKCNFQDRRDPRYTCKEEYSTYRRSVIKIKGNFIVETENRVDILPQVLTKTIKTYNLVEDKMHTLAVKPEFKHKLYRPQMQRFSRTLDDFSYEKLENFKKCYNKFERTRDDLYNVFLYLCDKINIKKILVPSHFDFNNMIYKNYGYPKKIHNPLNFCKEIKGIVHKKYKKKRMCHLIYDKKLNQPRYKGKHLDMSKIKFSREMFMTEVLVKPKIGDLVASKSKLKSSENRIKEQKEKAERERVKNMSKKERQLEKKLKKQMAYEERNRERISRYAMSSEDFDVAKVVHKEAEVVEAPKQEVKVAETHKEEKPKKKPMKDCTKKVLKYIEDIVKTRLANTFRRAYNDDWTEDGRSKDIKKFKKDYIKLVGEMGTGLGVPKSYFDIEDAFFLYNSLDKPEEVVKLMVELHEQ